MKLIVISILALVNIALTFLTLHNEKVIRRTHDQRMDR
jgi:hypothetical protein